MEDVEAEGDGGTLLELDFSGEIDEARVPELERGRWVNLSGVTGVGMFGVDRL